MKCSLCGEEIKTKEFTTIPVVPKCRVCLLSLKLDKAIEALEEIANGHLQEQVSEMIANKVLEKLK